VEAKSRLVPAGTRSAYAVGRAMSLIETRGTWMSGISLQGGVHMDSIIILPGRFLLPGMFNLALGLATLLIKQETLGYGLS